MTRRYSRSTRIRWRDVSSAGSATTVTARLPQRTHRWSISTHSITRGYSRLDGAGTYHIELVTPFVLESEYPEANDRPVPWWWTESREDLRLRQEKILEQREVYDLETVDHGQVLKYRGSRPIEIAKNGLLRIGSHFPLWIRRTADQTSRRRRVMFGEERPITRRNEPRDTESWPQTPTRRRNKEIVLPPK